MGVFLIPEKVSQTDLSSVMGPPTPQERNQEFWTLSAILLPWRIKLLNQKRRLMGILSDWIGQTFWV